MDWHYDQPVVGVGVMIWKDDKVLLGHRMASHGAGEWASPGGKLDYMESIEECAKRETCEEAGIEIKDVRFLRLMNLKDYPPRHFVDIAVVADWESGEPQVMEPDKLERGEWADPDNMPEPLFAAIPSYFEALKTGQAFWDA